MNAIQISGGVDSAAVLWYSRALWDDSVVMWCDTGASYPETHAYMERIKKMVPRFRTVYGNQPQVIKIGGWPVDVVPVKYTAVAEPCYGRQEVRFQSFFDCCRQSIWEPMQRACLLMGIDTIIRGQRIDDVPRAPIEDGHRDVNGIRYLFPIHDWSREDVFEFVKKECPDLMPDNYALGELSSRDCWNCTAYRSHNQKRVENLNSHARKIVEDRILKWESCVRHEMEVQRAS